MSELRQIASAAGVFKIGERTFESARYVRDANIGNVLVRGKQRTVVLNDADFARVLV